MSRLIWLALIGLLFFGQAGGLVPCPELSCCDPGAGHQDQGCDTSCQQCVCCLDRTPVDAVGIDPPLPVVAVSDALVILAGAPPAPEPSDILKVPKPPIA